MSKYKVFAVIGIGDIGTHVVDGFVAQGVVPVILTRKSSNTNYATKFPGSSLTVVRVESYEDVEEVANALKGNNIEVVVCTLANAVLALQYPLAEAAKQAGVKLFIPSEYGFVTQGASKAPKAPSPEQSILVWKDQFAESLTKLGLPYARVMTGSFFGYLSWQSGTGLFMFARLKYHPGFSSNTSLLAWMCWHGKIGIDRVADRECDVNWKST